MVVHFASIFSAATLLVMLRWIMMLNLPKYHYSNLGVFS
jgi:hypothetical protein